MNNSGVHEKEATKLLSRYLSKLIFTDTEGLRRPEEKLPQGFLFNHWRCSRRTLYTPRPGFTMIVSKEKSWCSDVREEAIRETVGNLFLNHYKFDIKTFIVSFYCFVFRRTSTSIVKNGTEHSVERTGNRK